MLRIDQVTTIYPVKEEDDSIGIKHMNVTNKIANDDFKRYALVVQCAPDIFTSEFTYKESSDGSYVPDLSGNNQATTRPVINMNKLMQYMSSSCTVLPGTYNKLTAFSFPLSQRTTVPDTRYRVSSRNLRKPASFQLFGVFLDRTGRPAPHFYEERNTYCYLASRLLEKKQPNAETVTLTSRYEIASCLGINNVTTDPSNNNTIGHITAEEVQFIKTNCLSGPADMLAYKMADQSGHGGQSNMDNLYGVRRNFSVFLNPETDELSINMMNLSSQAFKQFLRIPLTHPIRAKPDFALHDEMILQVSPDDFYTKRYLTAKIVNAEDNGFYPFIYAVVWDHQTSSSGPSLLYPLYFHIPSMAMTQIISMNAYTNESADQFPSFLIHASYEPNSRVTFDDEAFSNISLDQDVPFLITRRLFHHPTHDISTGVWSLSTDDQVLHNLAKTMWMPGFSFQVENKNKTSLDLTVQAQHMNMFGINKNVGFRVLQLYARCLFQMAPYDNVPKFLQSKQQRKGDVNAPLSTLTNEVKLMYNAPSYLEEHWEMVSTSKDIDIIRKLASAINLKMSLTNTQDYFLKTYDSKNPGIFNGNNFVREALSSYPDAPGGICFILDTTICPYGLPDLTMTLRYLPIVLLFNYNDGRFSQDPYFGSFHVSSLPRATLIYPFVKESIDDPFMPIVPIPVFGSLIDLQIGFLLGTSS